MRKIVTLVLALMLTCVLKAQIRCGAEQPEKWLDGLRGKRVALLTNHTALVFGEHLVDFMVRSQVNLVGIVTPEHGLRGNADAGEKVSSGVDDSTGIPVWSLYSSASRTLSDEQLSRFDILVVDIQDVGLRFYTYYITMLSCINRCADSQKPVMILDRPNPNGMVVDGPVLDMRYKSGVGALPIPVLHGLTMGEIALMAKGEGWSKSTQITVIPCSGYTHDSRYEIPVAPSPNLKSQHAIYLYASTCLFEGTVCSLGRGTDAPFEMYGHPLMKGCDFTFTPRSMPGAKNPPLLGKLCYGVDLRQKDDDQILREGFNLDYIIDAYRKVGMGEKFFTPFFEKLVGVPYVRQMIIQGKSSEEISAVWQSDLQEYISMREKYRIYE